MPKRPITSLHGFLFSTESYFGGIWLVSVNQEKWGGVNLTMPDRLEENLPEYKTSKKQWDKLTALVKKYKVHEWESYYEDNRGVMDGESWQIFIQYNGSLKRRSSGYVAGPEGIHDFIGELHEIFPMEADYWPNRFDNSHRFRKLFDE